jgi:hypothetical protein
MSLAGAGAAGVAAAGKGVAAKSYLGTQNITMSTNPGIGIGGVMAMIPSMVSHAAGILNSFVPAVKLQVTSNVQGLPGTSMTRIFQFARVLVFFKMVAIPGLIGAARGKPSFSLRDANVATSSRNRTVSYSCTFDQSAILSTAKRAISTSDAIARIEELGKGNGMADAEKTLKVVLQAEPPNASMEKYVELMLNNETLQGVVGHEAKPTSTALLVPRDGANDVIKLVSAALAEDANLDTDITERTGRELYL